MRFNRPVPGGVKARALAHKTAKNIYRANDAFLYDNASISTAATTNLFLTPQNSGTSAVVGSGGKTAADTSLDTAGLLPAGRLFKCYELGFVVHPAEPPEDVEEFLVEAVATLRIISDEVLLGPIIFWPGGAGPQGYAALYGQGTATERSSASNGVGAATARIHLRVPFMLEPQYDFRIRLETVVAPNTAIIAWAALFGTMVRRV